ncbi:MAG: hypothetical protein AAF986_11030 [Pseudomonadota bacterium]
MAAKAMACFAKLTEDEQASLKKICCGAIDRSIPDDHAQTLLELGLAEVNCGDIGPTSAGRVVMVAHASG